MKKPLKTYFDSAKEAPSLLHSSEIRNLVESPQPGVFKENISINKSGFKTMNIINISAVLVFAISFFVFRNTALPPVKNTLKTVQSKNSLVQEKPLKELPSQQLIKKNITNRTTKSETNIDSIQSIPNGPHSAAAVEIQPDVIRILKPDSIRMLKPDIIRTLKPDSIRMLKPDVTRQLRADVVGIRILDLSKEEFLKLGVKVDKKQVVFFKNAELSTELLQNARANPAIKLALTIEGIDPENPRYVAKTEIFVNGVSTGKVAKESEYNDIGLAPFTPVVSTHYRNGIMTAAVWETKDSAQVDFLKEHASDLSKVKSINTFLPLRTVLKDPTSKYFKETEVILWYEATPEFIALLPERFKTQLLKEIKLAESPTTEVISGKKFFDTWRTNSGAISSTALYPNPIRDGHTTLDFSLNEERIITVMLHDIFGRKLMDLRSAQVLNSGKHSFDIVLKDVAKGMYLLSVQTDHGEKAVQRIIVD